MRILASLNWMIIVPLLALALLSLSNAFVISTSSTRDVAAAAAATSAPWSALLSFRPQSSSPSPVLTSSPSLAYQQQQHLSCRQLSRSYRQNARDGVGLKMVTGAEGSDVIAPLLLAFGDGGWSIQAVRDAYSDLLHNPLFYAVSLLIPFLPLGVRSTWKKVPTPGKVIAGVTKEAGKAVGSAAVKAGQSAAKKTASAAKSVSAEAYLKLLFCILIDLGSDASETLPPPLSWLSNAIYGPVEYLIISNLFGSKVLAAFALGEEVLPIPFLDLIPTATAGWVIEHFFPDSCIGNLLGLGEKESGGAETDKQRKA